MSVQPELTDPRISAFLASDPNLRSPVLAAPAPPPPQDDSHLMEIAIGISAAFIAWRLIVRHRLQQERPRTPSEARNVTLKVITSLAKAWESLSVPPIKQAYSIVPYKTVQTLATDYATELGQYVNDTSVEALLEGFSSQINAGVGEGIAWDRAVNGYGLDPRQMKTYINGLMKAPAPRYGEPAIPANIQASLDKAVLMRADLLGVNESFKAVQVGKNMTWMAMQAAGDLPEGTKKKWVTAADERVCEVCGPLDGKVIPLHWRFKASNGEKFYAPGVHPRCRCELELVYPEHQFYDIVKALGGDEFDRDKKGRFSVEEERAQLGGAKLVLPKRGEKKSGLVLPKKEQAKLDLPQYGKLALPQYAKLDLPQKAKLDLGRQYEKVADDLQDEVLHPEVPGFRYDTEVLVPASQLYPRFTKAPGINTYEDYFRLLVNEEMEGQIITLDNEGYVLDKLKVKGAVPSYETRSFQYAYDNELGTSMKDAYEHNVQADKESGGRADRRYIAPLESGKDADTLRIALSGLNRKQLLYIIEETFTDSKNDPQVLEYINPDQGEETHTADEILEYYRNQDVNDVATAILDATLQESDERTGPLGRSDWKNSMKRLVDIHNKGRHYKRRQFRSSGSQEYRTGTPVIFRIANGWVGDVKSNPDGHPQGCTHCKDVRAARVHGRYRVASSVILPPPKPSYSSRPEHEYATQVLIIDLIPEYETQVDRPGLDLTEY